MLYYMHGSLRRFGGFLLMPTIELNPQYFLDLAQLPFPLLVLQLFLDGGWILVLMVLFAGFKVMWLQSRQGKYAKTISYTMLAIDVPKMNQQTVAAVEHIFSHFSSAYSSNDFFEKWWLGKFNPKFSFEIVSIEGYVQFLVRCPSKSRDLVEAAFFSQYPEAEIIEVADYVDRVPADVPNAEWDVFGTEFVLKKPYALPIRTYVDFEHKAAEEMIFKDPISSLLEAMSQLKRGEQLWLQLLVSPSDDSWKDKSEEHVNKMLGKTAPPKKTLLDEIMWLPLGIIQQVTGIGMAPAAPAKADPAGKMSAMTPGERAVLEAVQKKAAKVGFGVKMRLVYVGRRGVFSKGRLGGVRGYLQQLAVLSMNGFKGYGPVTPKGDYFWQRWSEKQKKQDIFNAYKKRSGSGATAYYLNTEELATIYHFPMETVKAPLVKKTEAKRSEPPVGLPTREEPIEGAFSPLLKKKSAPPPPSPKDDEDESAPPKNLPFA